MFPVRLSLPSGLSRNPSARQVLHHGWRYCLLQSEPLHRREGVSVPYGHLTRSNQSDQWGSLGFIQKVVCPEIFFPKIMSYAYHYYIKRGKHICYQHSSVGSGRAFVAFAFFLATEKPRLSFQNYSPSTTVCFNVNCIYSLRLSAVFRVRKMAEIGSFRSNIVEFRVSKCYFQVGTLCVPIKLSRL